MAIIATIGHQAGEFLGGNRKQPPCRLHPTHVAGMPLIEAHWLVAFAH